MRSRLQTALAMVAPVFFAVVSVAMAQATATPTPSLTATITPTSTVRCTGAAAGNPCIPGGGSARSDCYVEWVVTPVPTLTHNGIPNRRSVCYEGDPRCDADTDLTNKRCTFAPRMCVNNVDARLPHCVATDVATFEVTVPKSTSTDPADIANLAALEDQAGNGPGGFGLTVLRKRTPVSTGLPNPTPNLCSVPINVLAPLRESQGTVKRRTTALRTVATTSSKMRDTDSVKFECRPSTCGNGTIESDHEECDDGNRNDGDGCDRGCHLERFGVMVSGQSIAQPKIVDLIKQGLGCAWVRVNLNVTGDLTSYQNFKLFLDAGVNVVLTITYRKPANIDTSYGTLSDWPNAGFPFLSREQFQQDIRDVLAPVLSVLSSGRLWVQYENEVSDAALNPNAEYWRGTDDQYLVQLAAFFDAVRSVNRFVPVVLTSFASGNLEAIIGSTGSLHDYEVARTTRLLTEGTYDAADLHFYHCVEDIAAKAQWVKDAMPAGKRWISTENGGPDFRCETTNVHYREPYDAEFEAVQAQQVPARLSACADSGGSVCLWFSLFDLTASPEPFNHLGLLDQSETPPRHKPAYDAFQLFVATHR